VLIPLWERKRLAQEFSELEVLFRFEVDVSQQEDGMFTHGFLQGARQAVIVL